MTTETTGEDRVFLISADGQHKIDSTVQEIVEMFEFVRELMKDRETIDAMIYESKS